MDGLSRPVPAKLIKPRLALREKFRDDPAFDYCTTLSGGTCKMAGSKLKGAKPAKVVKPMKKKRRTTTTTKNFRFQGFSERIANLKIDPIRRRGGVEGDEELTEETATYFGRSLSEWQDLNLSTSFTSFVKNVAPYCDSLPMVLHHQHTIMDLLVKYIEEGDALAMEPLLSLLSHFAHDLGTHFEKHHFHRAVSTVTAVAAKHQDSAVVEWSFTGLAWMFKYLSRYLAADLQPLYDLMSPYLGKTPQKPFIIRFAAESLSFLLRKAASTYKRDPEALDHIVAHMLQDCIETADERSAELHHQGVLTLLTEAIKGVQLGLHSSGTATMQSLLKACSEAGGAQRAVAGVIATGTLTSLIHHTTADTFHPVFDTVINYTGSLRPTDDGALRLTGDLLFTMISVRKGTRVADWKPIVTTLKQVFAQAEQLAEIDDSTTAGLLRTLAVALQSAAIDAVLPLLPLTAAVRKGRWSVHFSRFCSLTARLGADRFRQFVVPQLQRFAVDQWTGYGGEICRMLPHISHYVPGLQLKIPSDHQVALLGQFAKLTSSSDASDDAIAEAYTILAAIPYLKLENQIHQRLSQTLEYIVERALDTKEQSPVSYRRFALSTCLERLLESQEDLGELGRWWPRLCSVSVDNATRAGFCKSLLRYAERCQPSPVEGPHTSVLLDGLVQALASPSHDVRESSLEFLAKLRELMGVPASAALSTALAVESTPVSLASSRAISMNIRKLAADYRLTTVDDVVRKVIPTYCFGLLHLRLAQAWDDAIATIIEICQDTRAEEVVISLAQAWLEGLPEPKEDAAQAQPIDVASEGFHVLSDFECSNLGKLSAISKQVFDDPYSGYPSPAQQLAIDQEGSATFTLDSRSQALRVLNKAPQLAEKRSRMLVPVLLRWAGAAGMESEDDTSASRWVRKDQKAMLAVFAKFNNPKVLYKSAEVYTALLKLCANGDVEIQRSALGAIFAWKDQAINRYEEHLVNMLDEARFREELSIFLQGGQDEEAIRAEDHPSLMPVLLRLLYGRAVAGGKHEQDSRRRAIFVALSRFGPATIRTFVDIATAPVSGDITSGISNGSSGPSPRQQLGMLNMLKDMLDTLGADLQPFAEKVLQAVLRCTVAASKKLDSQTEMADASLLRSVRQAGIQCLVHIHTDMSTAKLAPQVEVILEEVIRPRLATFASENTQSVSGMLRLFGAWAASSLTSSYLISGSDKTVLAGVTELLQESSAKDEVRLFVLQDILDKLLDPENAGPAVLEAHVTGFVQGIGQILSGAPSKDVLDAAVRSLTQLAIRITDKAEAQRLFQVCSNLLVKPSRLVSPGTKSGLLKTLQPLLDISETTPDDALFEAVAGLFSRMPRSSTRTLLCDVLAKICAIDDGFAKVASICANLNAQSYRLDQPDHELRERAFSEISGNWQSFNAKQWLPILHNCLFYIADVDDLVNRSSAAQALRLFIDAAATDQEAMKPLL
ncbi:U3 snoRNP protein, partial [Teratosphaeriaceae sp. CCFEE 6253]